MPVERVPLGRSRRTWLVILLAFLAAGAALFALVAYVTVVPPRPGPAETGLPAAGTAPAAGGLAATPSPGPGPAQLDPPVDQGTAEEHLALARRLLEQNRADAAGASREGMLRAEAEVQAALRMGPADLASARRLLADVNGALASDWADTDPEKRGHLQREREALRGLLEVAPGDGLARYRYAMLLEERGPRIEELTRAARLAPRDHRPRRALGEDLLEVGREDEGARLLVEAAELCDPEDLGHQGPDIVHLLHSYGREEEEARVRERMEKLGY